MKKYLFLIVIILTVFTLNCKKANKTETKIIPNIESTIKKTPIKVDGYRNAKWGMSAKEVEELIIKQGLIKSEKKAYKETGYYEVTKDDIGTHINFLESILDMKAYVEYTIKNDRLVRVLLSFFGDDKLRIKRFIDDKYGDSSFYIEGGYLRWDLVDTYVVLALENGEFPITKLLYADKIIYDKSVQDENNKLKKKENYEKEEAKIKF
jgi:hypothetical protein